MLSSIFFFWGIAWKILMLGISWFLILVSCVSGYIDFTSFMSYIPFFAKLLQVIMDSPLSIKNLEQARDRVMRKYSRSPDETTWRYVALGEVLYLTMIRLYCLVGPPPPQHTGFYILNHPSFTNDFEIVSNDKHLLTWIKYILIIWFKINILLHTFWIHNYSLKCRVKNIEL